MRPLLASLLAVAAGLVAWSGARYWHVSDAFGALAPHERMPATRAASQSGGARLHGASQATAVAAAHDKPAAPAAASGASRPVTDASAAATGRTPRERLAALRMPLSPEAQNDPFSVQSWLPPPPPPRPAPAETAQAAPPTAPPLPFSYVGRLNGDAEKPRVFLSNGDQLLIVSPGDVIDGRYRFESIAATEAVFTYLPLTERQVLTIEGEEITK
jgi:hypothetical protein